MGVSDPSNVPFVAAEIQRLQPTSVLDVGIGFGKWGVIVRECLEAWQGRFARKDWKVHIEGIEIFEPYRNPLWDSVYDRVHIGDAHKLLSTIGHFDVGICCDVIEHVEKDRGYRLLRELVNCCDVVILATPIFFWEQPESNGNVHERHLSHWRESDFEEFSGRLKELDVTFGAVLTKRVPGTPPPRMQRRLDHVGARLLLKALRRRMKLRLTGHGPVA
jgi:hypothetical protein